MKKSYTLTVAAALVVASLAGAELTSGAGESEPSAFVSIDPCRLLDTRPATKIGPISTLGGSTTRTATVRGTNGQCFVPATATAVSMNVTAVDGTASSFLTVWPSDAASRPGTSNLNWVPGAPPTPNKVDVALSADGKVSLFNRFGTVNVIADIVGYYETVVAAQGGITEIQVVKQTINDQREQRQHRRQRSGHRSLSSRHGSDRRRRREPRGIRDERPIQQARPC